MQLLGVLFRYMYEGGDSMVKSRLAKRRYAQLEFNKAFKRLIEEKREEERQHLLMEILRQMYKDGLDKDEK